MEHSPRILKEAKRQALLIANRIKTAYQLNKIKDWSALERQFSIVVPPQYKDKPFTWQNVGAGVGSFCQYWELSYEARLQTELTNKVENIVKVDKNLTTFHKTTLFAEQNGCFKSIYNAFFGNATEKAALQDGYTGSGKTYIAAALIAQAIKDGILEQPDVKWRLYPFIIFCPKAVAETWRRVLEDFGLSEYLAKRKILVFPDSDFMTDASRMFVDEHTDLYTEETEIKWNPILVPIFAVLDEYHRYVNPKTYRTQAIESLAAASKGKTRFLCMSATPMEKVNDSYLFTILAHKIFMGVRVDKDSFKHFAQLVDNRPDKPNREALKRLRSILSPNIFSIPYVKPKHKAINVVELVEFTSEKSKQIYDSAHERYKEACAKAGKNTLWGPFETRIALNNYRKTVEPLRSDYLAARASDNYHSGNYATAIGCAFKETIANVAFQLVDRYSIPREKISIVWGGRKEYRKEELLSAEEMDKIFKAVDPRLMLKDKQLRKRLRLTLRYVQDKEEHLESIEDQAYRHDRLRELRLVGKQSDNVRQIEIDKFQSGESRVVLFTIATGGIGLSFDKFKPELLTREGLFTPVYSGKEFQQLLGRLVRRASIADAIQRICMMRDTVEEFHVAPILDEKLKCIAEITNRNFDIVELLQRDDPRKEHAVVRQIDQATLDAENDNTIIADFADKETEDEDEDDDNIIPL